MNRAILIIGVVAVLAAVAWFWTIDPIPARTAAPMTQVEVVEQAAVVPDSTAKPVAPPSVAQPATEAPAAPATDAPEVAVASEALPAGPYEISLGSHSILLKTPPEAPKRMLEVELAVVTPEPITRREIINRRRQLVRMVFFLGTHRAASGAEGEAGRQLFAGHLLERFRNVIKTGAVTEVKITKWSIHDWTPPPPDEK